MSAMIEPTMCDASSSERAAVIISSSRGRVALCVHHFANFPEGMLASPDVTMEFANTHDSPLPSWHPEGFSEITPNQEG